MKRIVNRSLRSLRVLYRVLLAAALILGLVLLAGTAVGLIRGKNSAPLLKLGGMRGEGRGARTVPADENDETVYSGIGRLRIPAGNGGTVILSVAFPYPPGDKAFTEELVARTPGFRDMVSSYVSSLTGEELANPDEDKIKAELLRRFNGALRLGKIRTLYFSDFLLLE
ncbi:MAG: flagellar basal body-associated FliL family protein [Treponema sp.]|jgi:flagellar basal body-associated protein FliL|nr:flagellar basal body-associated FliL family protein [Treponema sp.]